MRNETRKVIHLDAGFPSSKRAAPGPIDNTFFLNNRIKLGDKALTNPYRQHAYFHSAVKRIGASLSQAPFRIFQEDKSTGTAGYRARKAAFEVLRKEFRKIPEPLWDIYHSHGETARRVLARDFMADIRRLAPEAPLGLVIKAVGVTVVEDGPWYALFRDVNPAITRSQLWEATSIYLNVDGEAFWVALQEGGRTWSPPSEPTQDPKAVPFEIFPMAGGPERWKEKVNEKTKVLEKWVLTDKRFLTKAEQGSKDKGRVFEANQVGMYKFFDPEFPLRGLAPAKALDIELKQDHSAARYNLGFFERGAQLPWVMVFEQGLSEPQREDVEEQLLRDYSGLDNMWKPAVFEGGAKIEKLGQTQRDMDYFTLRQWVRDEVLAVVGTPKSEMGIFQDVNRASAQVSKRVFWENTLLPLMAYFEDNTDSWLFSPVTGGNIFGVFDTSMVEALREDLSQKAKVANELFKMGFTPDEISERLDLGFETAPWRKVAWLNQNLISYDDQFKNAMNGPATKPAAPAPGEGPEDGGPEEPGPGSDGPGGSTPPDDDDDANDGGEGDTGGDPGSPSPEAEEESGIGPTSYPGLMGRAFDETDVVAVGLIQSQTQRVQRIVDTVRSQLVDTLQKGLDEGLDKPAMLAIARSKLKFITGDANVTSKAATETAQITSIARNVEMRRKGVKLNVWITSRDGRVRDDHVRLDAQEGEVGYNFAKVLGRLGDTLEFPLDPRAPADLVVNCRCVLIPSVEERTSIFGFNLATDEGRSAMWHRVYQRVMEPGEKKLKTVISKLFWRIRGAQLARIEEAYEPGAVKPTAETLAIPVQEFKDALARDAKPIYETIYSAALEELAEELEELGLLTAA